MALHASRVRRALQHPDTPGAGARARRALRGEEKVHAVMAEFKRGTLRSGGSGARVTNRRQAIAIALSEARRAGARIPARKGGAHGPGRLAARARLGRR